MSDRTVIVIPARYGSTRLPRKPLLSIAGKPLIQWVYERALQIPGEHPVIVATDHSEVFETVKNFGGEVVMTPADIETGSERVGFVVRNLNADIVVNLQGDEPLVPVTAVAAAMAALKEDGNLPVATVACPLTSESEWRNPAVVKVLLDDHQNAIYFSRSPIPYFRDSGFSPLPNLLRHIGVYVFRTSYLLKFLRWQPGILEQQEKLEQLRIIERGGRIKVIRSTDCSPGVDVPADLTEVERLLKQRSAVW